MTRLDGFVSIALLVGLMLLAPLGHAAARTTPAAPTPSVAADPVAATGPSALVAVDGSADEPVADSTAMELAAAAPPEPGVLPVPDLGSGQPFVVLLMGTDTRPDQVAAGDAGRTDTMILMSVDTRTHAVSMASIPRDCLVMIPGHGYDRVNTAYEYGELDHAGGGPALAKETVSRLFGVRVDRFALVSVPELQQIVDDLGGVWVDVPNRLVDTAYPTDDYGTKTVDIAPGKQLMGGELAVEYARMRHPDSDFGREARQQQVLQAIWQKALEAQTLTRLPSLVPHLFGLVRTDLNVGELFSLARLGEQVDASKNLVRVAPDAALTPPYIGPGGAAYVRVTPAYRAAVAQAINHPARTAEGLNRPA